MPLCQEEFGMIAFTGFVFSMAFLLVQFGSSAYLPRLTRFFLEHAIVRHALGMFIATFVYALIALSVLDLGDSEPGFPGQFGQRHHRDQLSDIMGYLPPGDAQAEGLARGSF